MSNAIKVYRHALSGHCHRIELMLSLLGLPATFIDVDLAAGEHKAAPFLNLNAFAQVPVLDDQGVILSDSNAILVYLERRYGSGRWLPNDPLKQAQVQRWLSVAAGPLANSAMKARLVTVFNAPFDPAPLIADAHELFAIVDAHLSQQPFLASDQATLAEVSLYSYIAHAPEGNVSLEPYPHIRAWLQRIEALEGFVPMGVTKVGLLN
ncbi:glutathione S-transferase family protein [Vreelandella venusta]|uniref:Glutathione S-transferase n=1 Tax=Vreelandella venusta TaxID=44935 RepID=A0AAP9ZAC8_9GAMM|nr:glutathione S-transferase [Halomonas venusta]MDW0358036.1 glutathione S-transferase [Halomonas venusta]QRL01697.1 glutathione S-transferase [Halomonas venusta]UQI38885.1 glutathione S-transferase [Halomonas venusta]WAM54043.1 glutathione S-transferase [Halomonas venusta]GEK51039.1 glutathione S-transferase [Halomonas venusta]